MYRGFISLWRKTLDNPVVMKDADHLAVWVYLLLNATHKEYSSFFGGSTRTLLPGELVTGRRKIAEKLKVDESKVQRILKLLENEQLIEQQTNNQQRLVKIVSWDTYQITEQQDKQQVNNERTTDEQRMNTYNNIITTKTTKTEKEDINDTERIRVEYDNHTNRMSMGHIGQPDLSVLSNPTQSSTQSSASEVLKSEKYSESFESFWKAYPSKVGKGVAAKKFKQVIKTVTLEVLLAAVERYCKSKKVLDGYICNPTTWLNQERWKDEESVPEAEDDWDGPDPFELERQFQAEVEKGRY